jgi:hypothetical protein
MERRDPLRESPAISPLVRMGGLSTNANDVARRG